MTWIKKTLGMVKKPIFEVVKRIDDNIYEGMIYTEAVRGEFRLVFEGLVPNPFLISSDSIKLDKSYVLKPLSKFEFTVLKREMGMLRSPRP